MQERVEASTELRLNVLDNLQPNGLDYSGFRF